MDVSKRSFLSLQSLTGRLPAGPRALYWTSLVAASLTGCQTPSLAGKNPPARTSNQQTLETLLAESKQAGGNGAGGNGLGQVPAASSPTPDEQMRRGEQELEAHSRDQNPAHLAAAKIHFEAVLRAQPGHPKANHRLAIIADLQKDFDAAARHYTEAMRVTPNDATLLHDIGYSLVLQGKHQDSIQYFQQSMVLAPGFEPAVRKLADAYVHINQPMLAQQTLRQLMPDAQAAQEVAQLQRVNDPAAKPSLFGKMRNNLEELRPSQRKHADDPTQQLLAEIEQARVEGERQRAQRLATRPAPTGQPTPWNPNNPNGVIGQTGVPDGQLSQALAAIDQEGRSPATYGQPVYLNRGAGPANYGAGVAATPQGGPASPWSTTPGGAVPQGAMPQQMMSHQSLAQQMAVPQGGQPIMQTAAMTGGEVPFTTFAPAVQYQTAGGPGFQNSPVFVGRAAPNGAGQSDAAPQQGQSAEVIRGNGREPGASWPNASWRGQGQQPADPYAAMQPGSASGIQYAAAALPAPGANSQQSPSVQQAELTAPSPNLWSVRTQTAPPMLVPAGQPMSASGGQQASFAQQPLTPQPPASFGQPPAQPMMSGYAGAAMPSPQDDLRAAAAAGLGAGPGQMLPVVQQANRASPGATAAWNGLQVPQTGRQLPTDRPPADLSQAYHPHGQPMGVVTPLAPPPNSLGQRMPSNGQYLGPQDQYATNNWGTQPDFQTRLPSPPMSNAAPYEQQRAQYDQQFNQLIQQLDSRAPGAVPSPSAGIPVDRPPGPAAQMSGWYRDAPSSGNAAPQSSHSYDGRQIVVPDQYRGGDRAPMQQLWNNSRPMSPPQDNPLPPPTYAPGVVVPEPYATNGWTQPSARPAMQPEMYGMPTITPRR